MISIIISDNWFTNPHTSGFLLFLLGGWILLALYHILLFIQNSNNLYLLYGFYLLSICGYQAYFLSLNYESIYQSNWRYIFGHPEFWAEASYLIYFLFAFKFLKLEEEFPKSYRYLKFALQLLTVYSLLSLIINIIDFDKVRATNFYLFFVVYILILSVITYVIFFKSRHPLRYYIIVGSLLLSFFSVLSLILVRKYSEPNSYVEWPYSFLYIGYILETLIFALGLGHLQYRIQDERNKSQKELINQLKENEMLRAESQKKLEKDVATLSRKAEKDKIENLKMRYEIEMAELKVAALRSQMNPHFLFNSLNSIKRYIIDNEQENAVYYLNKFSKLIRKILSSSIESIITLADELETAELYVNIENLRFNNSIDFRLKVDPAINQETLKVPSLFLQPFLENAIWHGLSNIKTNRMLILSVEKKDLTHLIVRIKDNGIGRKRSAEIKRKKIHKRQSVGITLTEERLQSFSKELTNSYSIRFIDLYNDKNEPAGTEVLIELPVS